MCALFTKHEDTFYLFEFKTDIFKVLLRESKKDITHPDKII